MTFNKLLRGLNKKDKKREDEVRARLESVISEIGEVFKRRGVTVYEMSDIIMTLLAGNNRQLVMIVNGKDKKLEEIGKKHAEAINHWTKAYDDVNKELKKTYAKLQQEESRGQNSKK